LQRKKTRGLGAAHLKKSSLNITEHPTKDIILVYMGKKKKRYGLHERGEISKRRAERLLH